MVTKWLILSLCVWLGVSAKPPNIVFILTDDQDSELGGTFPIPKAMSQIGLEGIIYKNMFVSSPLCCPSRSSILSGKYVHNHGGVNNSLSGGCSSAAWQQKEEPNAFPVFLKKAGYTNMFAGKYLNMYGFPEAGGVSHVPPGWDWWYGLVGNSRYYDYQLSVNGTLETHGHVYPDDYFTNYINNKAEEFLKYQSNDGAPFFMMLSTPACHDPWTPADMYMHAFSHYKLAQYGSFNVSAKNKHWLIEQAIVPIPEDSYKMMNNIFRNRWRTLLSVDDMVVNLYNILDDKGLLNNTYIFFASDNGFHLGQFGLTYDKRQLYEFDIRVPLMIRGPEISPGQTSYENVMNIDLAPTFIQLAGQQVPSTMDGKSLKSTFDGQMPLRSFRENVLIEHYGEHAESIQGCPQYAGQGMEICDMHCVCEDSWNNTFSCVRSTRASDQIYKYCIVKERTDFVEVYELASDPSELTNLADTTDPDLLKLLRHDLDLLSTCSGASCNVWTRG